MDLQLEGRVVLITGASRGIGRSVAEAFAAEGARLALCARGAAGLESLAGELEAAHGTEVLTRAADVGKAGAIEAVVAAAVERWGGLDILVNNAGGPPPGRFADFDDAAWQEAFNLSLLSMVRAVRAASPHLERSTGGRVINVLSTTVSQPLDGMVLSNSLRSAAAGLANTLSRELGAAKVTVNNVCPGHILSGRLRQIAAWRADQGEAVDPRKAVSAIPLGRLGRPREVADLVMFLASARGAYVTGATIPIDGGSSASLGRL